MDAPLTTGPLRDRLVAAGVEILEQEGFAELSLRAVTRRAGVSHGAPRRYFPTHRMLLAAIARTGLTDLAGRFAPTAEDAGTSPRQQLIRRAEVYLRFAAERPAMFELMFRHDLLAGAGGGLRQTSLPLFESLVTLVAQAAPVPGPALQNGAEIGPEISPRISSDSRLRALSIWTQLHGLAVLGAGQALDLVTDATQRQALIVRAVDANLASLAGAEPRDSRPPG